jgi:hypothetical protein
MKSVLSKKNKRGYLLSQKKPHKMEQITRDSLLKIYPILKYGQNKECHLSKDLP